MISLVTATAPYPDMGTVNATSDLSNILVYANEITNGAFIPLVLAGFFLVIFFSSFFAQIRFSGVAKPDTSFAVAGFATFGMTVLFAAKDGLVSSSNFVISLAIAIIGAAWVFFSED